MLWTLTHLDDPRRRVRLARVAAVGLLAFTAVAVWLTGTPRIAAMATIGTAIVTMALIGHFVRRRSRASERGPRPGG